MRQWPGDPVRALLLSHHPPEHMHRTLRLALGERRVRVCARCTGIALGAISGVFLPLRDVASLSPWRCVAILAALAVPAVLDFHRQLVSGHESNNPRRVATGYCFGLALLAGCRLGFSCGWAIVLVVPLIVGAWMLSVAVRPSGRLRLIAHLQYYAAEYERCRVLHIRGVSRPKALLDRTDGR